MSMSKKDFIALADAIREHNTVAKYGATDYGVAVFNAEQLDTLASFCKRQNSAFLRDRWLGYIAGTNGKNGGKVRP